MKISRFTMNPFGMNCYILWQAPAKECIVIDPGMMTADEKTMITSFLDANNLRLTHILLTHCHVDHACGAAWLARHYGAPIEASQAEEIVIAALPAQAQRFGLKIDAEPLGVDRYLKQDDVITLDGEPIKVLDTPGHSPGSLSFYCPESGVVFTGDALFENSIGRTDLLGASLPTLLSSIKTQLLTLPVDTTVAPGHGGTTTVGNEATFNPYL